MNDGRLSWMSHSADETKDIASNDGYSLPIKMSVGATIAREKFTDRPPAVHRLIWISRDMDVDVTLDGRFYDRSKETTDEFTPDAFIRSEDGGLWHRFPKRGTDELSHLPTRYRPGAHDVRQRVSFAPGYYCLTYLPPKAQFGSTGNINLDLVEEGGQYIASFDRR